MTVLLCRTISVRCIALSCTDVNYAVLFTVSCPLVTTYFEVSDLLFPCYQRRGVRQIMKSQVLINEVITQKASSFGGKAVNFY
jgi:hypothetical protein